MINIEPDASHTPDVLHDILEGIEVLRMKRQEQVRDRPHPCLKRFTQQELTDSTPAYSYFGLQPHVSLHYGTSPFGCCCP